VPPVDLNREDEPALARSTMHSSTTVIANGRKVPAWRVPSETSNTPTQSLWLPSHRQKWAQQLALPVACGSTRPRGFFHQLLACAPVRPWPGCRDDAAITPTLAARTQASVPLRTIGRGRRRLGVGATSQPFRRAAGALRPVRARHLDECRERPERPAASCRANSRKPSCLISWIQPGPAGGFKAGLGRQGSMKPFRRGGMLRDNMA
jgi:hypothetical protein